MEDRLRGVRRECIPQQSYDDGRRMNTQTNAAVSNVNPTLFGVVAFIFGIIPIVLWLSFLLPGVPSALVVALSAIACGCGAFGLVALFRQPKREPRVTNGAALILNVIGLITGIVSVLLLLS